MTIPEIKDKELHRITTTTLIYKSDFTYLITKRAMHKKMHPGKWTIPGGGLTVDDYINTPHSEHGENLWYGALEISLKREIREEVGLEIGKPELLTDMTFLRPDGIPVICFSYFTDYISGEVDFGNDPEGDTTDFAWVTLAEAKNYDLIDGIWDEIRQVDEILKSRKNIKTEYAKYILIALLLPLLYPVIISGAGVGILVGIGIVVGLGYAISEGKIWAVYCINVLVALLIVFILLMLGNMSRVDMPTTLNVAFLLGLYAFCLNYFNRIFSKNRASL